MAPIDVQDLKANAPGSLFSTSKLPFQTLQISPVLKKKNANINTNDTKLCKGLGPSSQIDLLFEWSEIVLNIVVVFYMNR
jgi:hypothetical protein